MEPLQTGEFIAFRTSPSKDGGQPFKSKQFARRSKNGCITCRRRHVRCDEVKPICQRCTRAQVSCFYAPETESSQTVAAQGTLPAPLSIFKTPEERTDLQFWLEVGGSNVGRWHYPPFYERILPQFSQSYESARYSLLALSTCARQWHLSDDNARAEVLARGDHYYSLACSQLLKIADNRASIEAALVSSLALFFYDSFTDHMSRRYIHTNAAISFLHSLKRGLTYNEVSGWRSESGRAGNQVVVETAEAYLDDISYSISREQPDRTTSEDAATSPQRTMLYHPIWLRLDDQSIVLEGDEIPLRPEPVEPPSDDWSIVRAAPAGMRECHAYVTLWHNWLSTWLINTSIPANHLRSSQSLCRQWHTWIFSVMMPGSTEMLSMQNRALMLDELFEVKLIDTAENDRKAEMPVHLERMLTLIASNAKLAWQISELKGVTSSSRYHRYGERQYLRGLAKVLEYVLRSADTSDLRERACAVFSLNMGLTPTTNKCSPLELVPDDPLARLPE